MSDPTRQLLEDRTARNAARGLVQTDIAFIKESVSARSLPARLGDRLSGGAKDIAGEAVMVADENRTLVGTGLAIGSLGLAAWVFRGHLKEAWGSLLERTGIGGSEPEEP